MNAPTSLLILSPELLINPLPPSLLPSFLHISPLLSNSFKHVKRVNSFKRLSRPSRLCYVRLVLFVSFCPSRLSISSVSFVCLVRLVCVMLSVSSVSFVLCCASRLCYAVRLVYLVRLVRLVSCVSSVLFNPLKLL